MPTYTSLTTLEGKDAANDLGVALENLDSPPYGIGVFEIEDGSGLYEVGAYFIDAPNEIELLILSTAYSAKPFVVSEVPDKDWVAEVRRELAPVEAGDFFVYGSHDSDKVPANCKPLLIEAAMAFGTGHHGTTKGCLTALDNLFKSGFIGTNVVDIGCGTAVLAMAAALCWSGKVLASDIDEIATETSKANAHANGLGDRIEVITCAGFDHPDLNASAPYDLILANILKGPLVALAPDMSKNSILGGYIILSGLLNTQADAVIDAYSDESFELVDHIKITEWSILTLRKI
ncbi:MAG: 50S ribosomal protein L11 methyltransferase [Amylibacter sp.]|jgi:ribosomal protein L11 methyltransferase|nr:50S ribosomal protein L11 methyltransferase [Amylibacter sp.]MDB9992326.1 50S ribosomal protein L11 methyltransferase [Amylibacter sp.]MDC0564668.1 50S ribosomal protein L11 methyltransferase [Amylibacter sp.]|tara:strand:- start:430 stop:1299 length:870 start_codon:yes stop_codon:yes gene_type:complete